MARLMYLLQVERLAEIALPNLTQQRPGEVQELALGKIVLRARLLWVEIIGSDPV